jgi:hypothetical protein
MDEFLGSFPTKKLAVLHFSGNRSRVVAGGYEIIGNMDSAHARTGRYVFQPTDAAREAGFGWAIDEAAAR